MKWDGPRRIKKTEFENARIMQIESAQSMDSLILEDANDEIGTPHEMRREVCTIKE